ncbi:hypothetical protein GCM10009838_34400 [Catenulispora subtropica]|uniref:Uncharacterized protein n=1 Tax=Catenulispora subtropica TaxID=450798 RepID=A0ABP5D439_9ACTN
MDPSPDCGSFIDGFSFVDLGGSAFAQAAVHLGGQDDTGSDWSGMEALLSYSGDGAHKTVEAIRKLVLRCPTGVDMDGNQVQFGVVDGAGVGDESLTVTARATKKGDTHLSDNDVSIIRRDNVLITVADYDDTVTGSSQQLAAVTKLADGKFTSR